MIARTQQRYIATPTVHPPFFASPALPVSPAAAPPLPPRNQPVTSTGPSQREALWESVVATQFAGRVGSKREKLLTGVATTATMGAAGALIALSIAAHTGPGVVALPLLAGANGLLGFVSLDAAVGSFRHTRPARPGALRRHSFYLTAIVPTRRQSRRIVAWLVEQHFVGEGRLRPILQEPTAQQLTHRGIQKRFPELTDTDVQQIAETLYYVRLCGEFAAARPNPPGALDAARGLPAPWEPGPSPTNPPPTTVPILPAPGTFPVPIPSPDWVL